MKGMSCLCLKYSILLPCWSLALFTCWKILGFSFWNSSVSFLLLSYLVWWNEQRGKGHTCRHLATEKWHRRCLCLVLGQDFGQSLGSCQSGSRTDLDQKSGLYTIRKARIGTILSFDLRKILLDDSFGLTHSSLSTGQDESMDFF